MKGLKRPGDQTSDQALGRSPQAVVWEEGAMHPALRAGSTSKAVLGEGSSRW